VLRKGCVRKHHYLSQSRSSCLGETAVGLELVLLIQDDRSYYLLMRRRQCGCQELAPRAGHALRAGALTPNAIRYTRQTEALYEWLLA
jgi:hypothetical protein